MKKLAAFLLILALLIPLTGCSTVPTQTTEGGTVAVPTTTQTPATAPKQTQPNLENCEVFHREVDGELLQPVLPEYDDYTLIIRRVPETVENPQNLPVLKCLYFRTGYPTEVSELPVQEANQMLSDLGTPYRFQFVVVDFFPYPDLSTVQDSSRDITYYPDFLQLPQVQTLLPEMDLISNNLSFEKSRQYLYPITDYVTGDAQPSLKNVVAHQINWSDVTDNGEIYSIPDARKPGNHGWVVSPEFMDKYGLSAADFQKDFWEMDELFAKIYAANGNQPFMRCPVDSGVRNQAGGRLAVDSPAFQAVTDHRYMGIGPMQFALDLQGQTPKVVYTLKEETLRKIQEAVLRYKDAGYHLEFDDPMITQAQIREQTMVSYEAMSTSRVCTNVFGKLQIPVTPLVYTQGSSSTGIVGIYKGSDQKELAISFFKLLSENEALRNTLSYGKEGREYVKVEGVILPIKYWMPTLSPLCATDSTMEGTRQGLAYEGMSMLETYRTLVDESQLRSCKISFDFTKWMDKLTALDKTMVRYTDYLDSEKEELYTFDRENPQLWYKKPRMTKEYYEEMLQTAKSLGIDEIKADLQAQLDAWLEDYPDWTGKVG